MDAPNRVRRTLVLAGVIAAMILLLAYQVKATYTLGVGGAGDYYYLGSGFYYPEGQGNNTFRWTARNSSLIFPGLGGHAPVRLEMVLQGWRPVTMTVPAVNLLVNQQPLTEFTPSSELSACSFDIPSSLVGWSGDLGIGLQTSNVFVPSEAFDSQDTRKLGLLVSRVSVTQTGGMADFVVPPVAAFVTLWLAGMSVQMLFLQLNTRPAWGTLALLVVSLGLGYAVGWHRLSITRLGWVPLVCGVAVNLVVGAWRWVARGPWHIARDERPIIIALVLALAGLRYLENGILHQRTIPPVDFSVDYTGATVLRRGGMVYDLEQLDRVSKEVIVPNIPALHESVYTSYDNPPFTAIVMLPFTLFPWDQAKVLYRTILHLLYWASVWLILDASVDWRRYPRWLLLLLLAFTFEPAFESFTAGQVDIPIFFTIMLGYWAFKRGRPWLSGAALAVGAMIKLSPALLLFYFLYKRQVKPFIAGVVACAALLGISIAITGPDDWLHFVTQIMPILSNSNTHFENQTLIGLLRGLVVPAADLFRLGTGPVPAWIRLVSLGATALIAGMMLWLFWQPRRNEVEFRFDVEFSLGLVALLIVSTVAWPHYYVWTLLPLAVLLKADTRNWLTQREYVLGAMTYGLTWALINFPLGFFYQWPVDFYSTHWPWRLLLWLKLYGAFVLLGILVFVLARIRRGRLVAPL